MKYLEFTFYTHPCTETVNDVLAAVLAEIGFESFVSRDDGIDAYVCQNVFDGQALTEALNDFPVPDVRITYESREAEDKDWNEEWEKNFFQPILIDNRCVIHSTFHTDVPKAEYDIVINPQMAFGTGHHETTSLVIEELLESDLAGKSVLDMGCGTSILAILARMRGAASCTAVDIDEWCVRNSLENIALNETDCIRVFQGDAASLSDKGPFDLVIANINRNILLNDMRAYVSRMRPASTLLVSGFYTDDIPLICDEARRCGLRFVRQREKNRWAAVRFELSGETQHSGEEQHTICLRNAVARNPLVRLAAPASLDLLSGEHLAIVGPNGAGKSLLTDLLTGKFPLREGTLEYDFRPSATRTAYGNIKYIAFRDTYGTADTGYYYQQRWNQMEQDDAPTVRELLGRIPEDDGRAAGLLELFGITPLMDKKILLLSSGELRKFQLAKALLTSPRILIMDNPFIGLDAQTRNLLLRFLDELSRMESLQIILILSMMDDIPPFITHVLPVEQGKVGVKMECKAYLEEYARRDAVRRKEEEGLFEELARRIEELPCTNTNFTGDEVVQLNRVSIRYGARTILHELDWTVRRGEKWALGGDNGSGKSTLLSLVCADNPQSYACDISLFGRKRGTGESIWEIKKHIGYVSPEMHRAYLKDLPAIEIVASGLHDSIGLYKRPHPEQMAVCEWWMDIFGVASLKDKPFLQLSSGEQRLALLARAFVKDPELLILDEPLHGLDTYNRRRVKRVIEAFCRRPDKTLIMVTHYERELPSTITDRLFLHRHESYTSPCL